VQQAYRALGRLPQVEFEQLTERDSSKWRLSCTRCKYHTTVDCLVKPLSQSNIFLLHTLCFIAIQPFWPAPQNLPLGPPTIVTASWHTSLRPCPYRLTAPIPLHTYPTPCTSSYTYFGPARASSMHSATKLNLFVVLSSCKQKSFLDSTASSQLCRPICTESLLLKLAACS